MSASRARRIAVAAITSLTLVLSFAPAASAAGPQLPLPDTMAAVGDSITQAASTGGSLGADAPQNSWSTGTTSTVNSHYLRLLALGAPIQARAFNHSVSGAKMVHLAEQMASLGNVQPDYLTVLIGGNDLCTPTFDGMTSVPAFRAQFEAAMTKLVEVSPGTRVLVVSIPDVYQLWDLFKGNWWARFVWSVGGVCQSLLANPTSTQQVDVQRRAAVRQRNIDFNTALAQVCAAHATRCLFDGNAAFNTRLTASDVSGDYFHPSAAGQAKLAAVSWQAGYTFVSAPPPNHAPTAVIGSAPSECTTGVSCIGFDAAGSFDPDGTALTYSWDFGDGTAPVSGSTATHTYTVPDTYAVTLTVGDGTDTDTATTTVVVVDSPPTPNQAPTAVIGAAPPACTAGVSCTGFSATGSIDPDGDALSYTWDFGDGTSTTAGASASHTFATPGDFTVTLTVDDGELSDSATYAVSVGAAPVAKMSLASFTASGVTTGKNTWQARATFSVTGPDGQGVNGATVSVSWGSGAGSCTTSAGSCTVTTENLNVRKVGSVTFTLTGISHSLYAYDLPDPAPSRTAARP